MQSVSPPYVNECKSIKKKTLKDNCKTYWGKSKTSGFPIKNFDYLNANHFLLRPKGH